MPHCGENCKPEGAADTHDVNAAAGCHRISTAK